MLNKDFVISSNYNFLVNFSFANKQFLSSKTSRFGNIKGINFGGQFQFLDTNNQNVKSKVLEGIKKLSARGRKSSGKDLPLNQILIEAFKGQQKIRSRRGTLQPDMIKKGIKLVSSKKKKKQPKKTIPKVELSSELDHDIQILQLKQKQKFVKGLRNLAQSRKMQFVNKTDFDTLPADPIVESVRRQLEEEEQPYYDPDDPSIFITYINGEVSRINEPQNKSGSKTSRGRNMKQYLDQLQDQFYF